MFTQVKGREAIFWQTQKTARTANPGAWGVKTLSAGAGLIADASL